MDRLRSSVPRPLALRDQGNGQGDKDKGKNDEGNGEKGISVLAVSAAVSAPDCN